MIYPSTTWLVDPPEGLRGIEHVVELAPRKQGIFSRLVWWTWGILSTYLGRRE